MSQQSIDFGALVPTASMQGEDREETDSLHRMLSDARSYISSHRWCPPIAESYLGYGVGDVVALFLFRLEKLINETDDLLWVVVGDLPPAFFVTDQAPTPGAALKVYCDLMDPWVHAALNHLPVEGLYPVNQPATSANGALLKSRIDFIRKKILPEVP